MQQNVLPETRPHICTVKQKPTPQILLNGRNVTGVVTFLRRRVLFRVAAAALHHAIDGRIGCTDGDCHVLLLSRYHDGEDLDKDEVDDRGGAEASEPRAVVDASGSQRDFVTDSANKTGQIWRNPTNIYRSANVSRSLRLEAL